MSKKSVCDRCQSVIHDPCVVPFPPSNCIGGLGSSSPGVLLVTHHDGKYMTVAGMESPPDGTPVAWIGWRDDFDLCKGCIFEVIEEVYERLSDARGPMPRDSQPAELDPRVPS